MNKLIKKTAVAASVLALGLNASADALNADWLSVSGEINFDYQAMDSADYESNLRTQDAELVFEALVTEGIRVVVKTELERALRLNGVDTSSTFDLEAFIEEAYIEIQTDAFGLPRAIIRAGKHQMAWAQGLTGMPMFKDNLLYALQTEKDVIGLTVELPGDIVKVVDSLAISVFETGAMDMDISDEVGFSVQAKKQLTDRVRAQVSYLYKEGAAGMGDENRGSLGFVYSGGNGSWQVWVEGIVFENNPTYPSANFATTVGASKQYGPGTVVIEWSYIENFAHEIGAAYNIPVGKNLTLSPEIRHTMNENAADDTRIGVRARIKFTSDAPSRALFSRK